MTNLLKQQKRIPKLRFPGFDGEWEEKRLGEVCNFFDNERIPLKSTDRQKRSGKYAYYGASGIIDYIDDYIFDGEYILLGEDGANIIDRSSKLAFLAKGKFWVNNHAHVLQAIGSSYFLAEYLESLRYEKYNTGTAQPKLNSDVVKKIKIVIPKKEEQQKIAEFLGSVDDWISNLRAQKEGLEKYKKGVMQKIFSEGKDWEEKRLGEIGDVIGGGTPETSKGQFWNGEMNWFTPTEIKKKYSGESLRKISTEGLRNSSAKILPVGALLLTTRATIGDVSIAMKESTTNQGFQSIVVNKKNSNEFMYYWILHNKKEFIKRANGSTFPEISGKEVKKIKGWFPTLKEQQKIAEFLISLDNLIESKQKQITLAEQWKKGLMQRLFV